MNKFKYVASCNFTLYYPELSLKVQEFMSRQPGVEIIRCCTKSYKVKEFEDKMPECAADKWRGIEHYSDFDDDTAMVSVCQNCTSIFQETQPDVMVLSLWEYILEYVQDFPYPDYGGIRMTLQDCWRQHDNKAQQNAVRELLQRMNIEVVELHENRDKTKYCGTTTLRATPQRNLVMAPKRYVENAQGFFEPHTPKEQKAYMEEYCKQITTDAVVGYCHYCTQGFNLVGQKNYHLAELLFKISKLYFCRPAVR